MENPLLTGNPTGCGGEAGVTVRVDSHRAQAEWLNPYVYIGVDFGPWLPSSLP